VLEKFGWQARLLINLDLWTLIEVNGVMYHRWCTISAHPLIFAYPFIFAQMQTLLS